MLKLASTEYLARASAERPKRTIAVWLVVLVAAFVAIATLVDGTMTTEFYFLQQPGIQAGQLASRIAPQRSGRRQRSDNRQIVHDHCG